MNEDYRVIDFLIVEFDKENPDAAYSHIEVTGVELVTGIEGLFLRLQKDIPAKRKIAVYRVGECLLDLS